MNGISVMSCVQSAYGSGPYSAQGKRITISTKRQGDTAGNAESRLRSPKAASTPKVTCSPKVTCTPKKSRKPAERGGNTKRNRRRSSWTRIFLLSIVFICTLAGFCIMTRASSREKEKVWKYYTTVTIGYDEDLTDVVFRYCDSSEYASAEEYVREICEINGLPRQKGKVPELRPGTEIVIPYFSTEYK